MNDPGSDGTHALPLAIANGHDQFALELLALGADPNTTIDGVYALHAAAGDVSTWLASWSRTHGEKVDKFGDATGLLPHVADRMLSDI